MKSPSFSVKSKKGVVLLVAMLTTAILLGVIAAALAYTVNNYRNSTRKLRLVQVKASANNEMEYLFYRWVKQMGQTTVQPAEQVLLGAGFVDDPNTLLSLGAHNAYLANDADPLADTLNVFPRLPAPVFNRALQSVALRAQGSVKNSSSQITRTGNVKFYTAKVRAVVTDPVLGTLETRVGRRFTYQSISACNGAIYYQNDMEWGVGSNMDIYGDIECNGSVYMGSSATLAIHDSVYFKDTYNGSTDPMAGSQRSIDPNPPAGSAATHYNDPNFSSNLNQTVARSGQVHRMGGEDNMLGFSDPADPTSTPAWIASHYPAAYPPGPNDPTGVNSVFRSLISPPPVDAGGNPIPEDPRVAATRTYNKAGLRITITGNSVTVVDPSNPAKDLSALASAVTATRTQVWDAREGKNVNMSTLDLAQLTTAITSAESDGTWSFNGVLYIYDTTTAAMDPSSTGPNAIRVQHATKTPNFDYTSVDPNTNSSGTGFTLCTDNGLYVQGDLNTATQADPNGSTNRTSVMADAVTLLSKDWNDLHASNSIDPALPNARLATADITINSAILSGNVATAKDGAGNFTYDNVDPSAPRLLNSSGGVQNLVRYLENWYNGAGAHTSTIHGSIAQLFYSKYFTAPFKPNTVAYGVYMQPTSRQMVFDASLASNPPNGVPSSVQNFYRGELFEWDR